MSFPDFKMWKILWFSLSNESDISENLLEKGTASAKSGLVRDTLKTLVLRSFKMKRKTCFDFR